jgi:hypothetical protein
MVRRVLALACTAGALGVCAPCAAARENRVVNTILTSRFLERERCDNLGLVSVQLLAPLHAGAGANQRPGLSREQVREITTRYIEINAQLCDAVTAMFAGQTAWARNYGKLPGAALANEGWERFLNDEHAVRWADIAARFRTELMTLDSAISLAATLRPDAFITDAKRLRALHLPETRRLLSEIRRVSLTDAEAKVRFALATQDTQPGIGGWIPARLDVAQLAAIEAKTRQIGLQLLNKYDLYLEDLYHPGTRLQMLTVDHHEQAKELAAKVRTATAQLKALASTYR